MRSRRKVALVLLIFLSIGAVVLISFKTHRPERPDFLDPAKTLAYSNLVSFAAQIVRETDVTNRSTLTLHNSQIADLQRLLKDPIEAPDAAYDGATMPTDFMYLKPLGKSLVSYAQDAERNGRYKDAINSYLAVFQLACRFEHGPYIYFLVGAAIERIGLRNIKTLIPNLSSEELSAFAKELQSINRERIPFKEIVRRENYFAARNTTNILQLARARLSPQIRKIFDKSGITHRDLQTQLEGIGAAAAILAYSRENPAPLTNLQSLVPKYLKSIPIDPHTGAPLQLLSTAAGPVVYSLGENKHDDSGRGDDIVFYLGK
jgi:hypothetical protein